MEENRSSRPFRFLDLPAEMRLMVYESIPFSKRYIKAALESPQDEAILFISMSYPLSLLATCRFIKLEASPILDARALLLAKQPVRFIIHWERLPMFSNPDYGFLQFMLEMAEVAPGDDAGTTIEAVEDSSNGRLLEPYLPLIERASQKLRRLQYLLCDAETPIEIVVLGCPMHGKTTINGSTTHNRQVHKQLEEIEMVCKDFDASVALTFRSEEPALEVLADQEPLWSRCGCFMEDDVVKILELKGPEGWERDWLEGDGL